MYIIVLLSNLCEDCNP